MGIGFGPSLDDYTSPYTGRTGPEAYQEDLDAGRITVEEQGDGGTTDDLIQRWLEDQAAAQEEAARERSTTTGTSTSTSATTTTGQSTRRSRTTGRDVSVTEQISRRFIDIPTEEKFLDDFSNAFAGFAQGAVAAGLGGGDLVAMMSQDFVQGMMNEYIGNLTQRALRGEELFELVGTEADFRLIRREPGTESVTRGRSTEETRTEGESTSESRTRGGTTDESATEREGGGGSTRRETGTSTSTSTSRDTETGLSTSEKTRESRFRDITEVMSRPEISAVYKFSGTDFLTGRFGDKMDEATLGRLSTEIRASAAGKRGGKTGAVSARRA